VLFSPSHEFFLSQAHLEARPKLVDMAATLRQLDLVSKMGAPPLLGLLLDRAAASAADSNEAGVCTGWGGGGDGERGAGAGDGVSNINESNMI
jgi:hypothetical protein